MACGCSISLHFGDRCPDGVAGEASFSESKSELGMMLSLFEELSLFPATSETFLEKNQNSSSIELFFLKPCTAPCTN